MKFIRFLLIAISLLSISATPASPPQASVPEITAGLTEAVAGVSPLTGLPSGWYTSDVTLHIIAPADVLANGKPMPGGRLTISDEGQHQVELQPGPAGQANTVTQIVDIDKTAPRVTWITGQNSVVSGSTVIRAEITDATSGICRLESSLDHGRSWELQYLAWPTASEMPGVDEISWSMERDFTDFPRGAQILLLRAHDCAGNVSPGEILVVRVE